MFSPKADLHNLVDVSDYYSDNFSVLARFSLRIAGLFLDFIYYSDYIYIFSLVGVVLMVPVVIAIFEKILYFWVAY